MANYKITTGVVNDGLYVFNADTGLTISGPYKNEESAKRRIRDLKRKESEAVKPIASPHADNVAKLAASSEYGKFTGPDIVRHGPYSLGVIAQPIPRQRGCYPAISKHSYQR